MQFSLTPLPLIEHQLCQFVSYLANDGLSHVSIKGYLAALRHLQISNGLPDPAISAMPKLEGVVKGIKVTQARVTPNMHKRLPITPDILLKVCQAWESEGPSHDQVMLWAATTLFFFGFMRSGEITVPADNAFDPGTHITFEDLSVDNTANPQFVKLRLKSSKTDPFRRGVDIVVGRTFNKLCPVAAIMAYLMSTKNPQASKFSSKTEDS